MRNLYDVYANGMYMGEIYAYEAQDAIDWYRPETGPQRFANWLAVVIESGV